MPSRDKYGPDLSWTDIEDYAEHNLHPQHLHFCFRITPQANLAWRAYVEVTLYPYGKSPTAADAFTCRFPFDPRRVSGIYSQLLRALGDTFREWENNPWYWPGEQRRKARGE